ncbi:MAG: response regulator transcription factor [Desulfobacterales bacterium]|nr:response regulator transcription factor [Desulfobacterales bacterium]
MGEKHKPRIVIAEDYRILREGLRALLSFDGEFEIAGEAKDGQEALRQVEQIRPELLLLDLSLPRMNGAEVIREIKNRRLPTRILVLTVHADESQVYGALKAGADGYLLKTAGTGELTMAIRSVLAGRPYLSPSVSRGVIEGYLEDRGIGRPPPSWQQLSKRERQVLKRIAEGAKNREIAQELSISIKTVEKHRANLMRKLDLHNTAALTAFAIERGLLK